MKTYARIENSIVVEIIKTNDDLSELYHADIIKTFVECSSAVQIGMIKTLNGFEVPISIDIDLKQAQYDAIENHISVTLKTANIIGEPADYDSTAELVGYRTSNNDQYRIEANTLWNWVEVCHERQYQIKHGVIKYDSIDDAIADLPSP